MHHHYYYNFKIHTQSPIDQVTWSHSRSQNGYLVIYTTTCNSSLKTFCFLSCLLAYKLIRSWEITFIYHVVSIIVNWKSLPGRNRFWDFTCVLILKFTIYKEKLELKNKELWCIHNKRWKETSSGRISLKNKTNKWGRKPSGHWLDGSASPKHQRICQINYGIKLKDSNVTYPKIENKAINLVQNFLIQHIGLG